MYYVVEYDDTRRAWLVEVQSRACIAIEHGMVLDVHQILVERPLYQHTQTTSVSTPSVSTVARPLPLTVRSL